MSLYLEGEQYQKALDCFLNDLEILQKFDDLASITQTLNNLAITFRRLGQINLAVASYEQCLDLKQTFEDEPGELLTLLNYAHLLSEKNYAEQLRAVLARAQMLAERLRDQEALQQIQVLKERTNGEG